MTFKPRYPLNRISVDLREGFKVTDRRGAFPGRPNLTRELTLGQPPPVLLVSDSACSKCPLSLLCLQRRPLGRQHSIAVCHRCWCLSFVVQSRIYVCGRLRYGHFARPHVHTRSSKQFLSCAIFANAPWGDLPMMKFGCHDHYIWTIGTSLSNEERERAMHRPARDWGAGHWSVEHPLNCCKQPSIGSFDPYNIWEEIDVRVTITREVAPLLDKSVESLQEAMMQKLVDEIRVPLVHADCLSHIERDSANGVVSL